MISEVDDGYVDGKHKLRTFGHTASVKGSDELRTRILDCRIVNVLPCPESLRCAVT